MEPRITDALGYIGNSDHRYETGIIGGGLLFVAEYVFVFSGRPQIAGFFRYLADSFEVFRNPLVLTAIDYLSVALGVVALTIPVGYLLTVVGRVGDGHQDPPSFLPFQWTTWLEYAGEGSKGVFVLGAFGYGMYLLLRFLVSLLFAMTPAMSHQTIWLRYVFDLFSVFTIVFVFFLVPYVIVAAFLLLGMGRSLTNLGPILVGQNRQYLSSWGPLIVLLLFNSKVAGFVYRLSVEREVDIPTAGTDSMIAAFLTFWLLIAIVYLFADSLSEASTAPKTPSPT